MKVVVQYSAGRGSFCAAVRAKEKFGADEVTLLFCDVQQEDSDCYRFLAESVEVLGLPLEVVTDGRTPWDLADDEGLIPNSKVPLCSRVLKHEPAQRWIAQNAPDALIVVGIGAFEIHRKDGIAAGHAPRSVWFPMCDPPYVDERGMTDMIKAFGIEPPRMYAAGYPHANCAGGCFRAGHAAWRHLLRDSPDLFMYHEWREQNFRRRRGTFATVLRWRSGPREGEPMTLTTLRRAVEAGREDQLDLLEWGGCGCTPGDPAAVAIEIGRRPS